MATQHRAPILVDGPNLIKRAIMASAPDDLKANETFTGGIYGSLNMLRTFLARPDVNAGQIFMFFDGGIPTRRLKYLPDYKSGRQERRRGRLTPEQYAKAMQQLPQARRMFDLLGVITMQYRDREADDCIAAAVRYLSVPLRDSRDSDWNPEPIVVSSDKDLYQCVLMGVRVWDIAKRIWVTRENFEEVTGVELEHYVLFRALVGDSSDSIPGAPGVGPIRAAHLIREQKVSKTSEPSDQLTETVNGLIRDAGCGLRRFEVTAMDHAPRLHRVIQGIDLMNSFGPPNGLHRNLQRKGTLQMRKFWGFCGRYNLQRVLQDPQRWTKVFLKTLKEES